jgi:prophage antirepressor-like protein
MMNNLQIFKNENWEIQILDLKGKPFFEASKVAKCLGYEDAAKAIRQHCKGRVKYPISENTGLGVRNIEKNFIPESDLYRLIMRSNLPNAEKFQDWVCEDVLPSIRQFGSYSMPKNYKEALLCLVAAEEEKEKLIKEKAWISEKREATAMNTASQKVKENNKLKMELGKCKEFATILAVERLTKGDYSWRKLKNYCNAKELKIHKVPDERYGTVKSYPALAWKEIYNINLEELF